MDALEYFHANYVVNEQTGCWEWTARLDEDGYARMRFIGKNNLAHRFSYERYIGPIPPGMEIDHLCRNRRCVNPNDLEAVTHRENVQRGIHPRKTHCPQGHAYGDTDVNRRGAHDCRLCKEQRTRAAYLQRVGRDFLPPNWREGSGNPNAKLTEARVREIHRMRLAGASTSAIASRFDMEPARVREILRGQTWRSIACEFGVSPAHVLRRPSEVA